MKHDLHTLANYHATCSFAPTEAIARFACLLSEYEATSREQKHITEQAWRIGVNTFIHVFRLLILYTKNLDLAVYHTQRGIYYFVQFIGQIAEEPNGFLQLAARDATMFVLKKTVFEVSTSHRKTFACPVGSDPCLAVVDTGVRLLGTVYRDIESARDEATRSILNCSIGCDHEQFGHRLSVLAEAATCVSHLGKKGGPILVKLAKAVRKKRPSQKLEMARPSIDDVKAMAPGDVARLLLRSKK